MDKRKIILDCDPGHDDAVAIMLAAKSPQIDLLGITVVAGNQTLEKTTANALNVCQYLGLDIPVYAGCGQPMIRDKQVIADDIHGETGLDGPVFAPLRKKAEDKHAVLYIIAVSYTHLKPHHPQDCHRKRNRHGAPGIHAGQRAYGTGEYYSGI